ncbi:MAG: alanine racemase, partial [Bdellovibrionales bacterium]|nr:alanine racemase [Bdellovibrionales bacterium]
NLLALHCENFRPRFFAVSSIEQATVLSKTTLARPIMILGDRRWEEILFCVEEGYSFFVHRLDFVEKLSRLGEKKQEKISFQINIDTGMSRYGVSWRDANDFLSGVRIHSSLHIEGLMTHLAQSDELDKSFAGIQLERFQGVVQNAKHNKWIDNDCLVHGSNTGGYLDLPHAHFDAVRLGILPLGVYPSETCRRIEGIKPVMSLTSTLASTRNIEMGDHVGYGMHFTAKKKMKIGTIPLGYGQGYPRLRNQGFVLIRGKRAPIIGGNSMDASMVDLSRCGDCQTGDEVILLGSTAHDQISCRDLASWSNTVPYEIMLKLGKMHELQ